MEYAQLNKDGKDATQITSHGLIEWDDRNYCTAEALVKDGKAGQFRVVELIATDPPIFDPLTQSCVRDGCEKVKGKWQYKWRVDALSPEQIAANAEAARLASIPHSLTRRQFKLTLIRLGLYETVESMISASADLELRITYQEAQDFERTHPMILQMAESLGKTDAELDDLFILGGTL